ncbi:hypothetical protein UFOVP706_67 [uncultured Caudovirales phage]|jgi:hypothetical protein|uniref:Uncharacterized protein n=1 Tax=uncultured Caudovirales phage TaxID=2100421 RepID=A0A6J5NKI9_9CAUD|nr:hypothetical protein UFOVP706_67 [uncultured Caudovirales phage]
MNEIENALRKLGVAEGEMGSLEIRVKELREAKTVDEDQLRKAYAAMRARVQLVSELRREVEYLKIKTLI